MMAAMSATASSSGRGRGRGSRGGSTGSPRLVDFFFLHGALERLVLTLLKFFFCKGFYPHYLTFNN